MKNTFIRKLSCLIFIFAFIGISLPAKAQCPTITISPSGIALPAGTVGAAYSQAITQTGLTGTLPVITWAIIGVNVLPTGLSIDPITGIIAGTPTMPGTRTFTVGVSRIVTASLTCSQTQVYSIQIACPILVFTNLNNLFNTTVGTNISFSAAVTGNVAPVIYGGTINPSGSGLTINATTGLVSAAPISNPGTYTITVEAAQGLCSVTRVYTMTVTCPTGIIILPVGNTLATATVGLSYSHTFALTGGISNAITWSLAPGSGPLPPGLTLNTNTGVISGTAAAIGSPTASFPFQVNAVYGGCLVTKNYTLFVNAPICPIINVSPAASAFTYTVGTAITSINLSATGGVAPYTYAISTGALPAGINIASGVISGTPTTVSNGSFTVRATAANGCTGTITYTFTVNSAGCPTINVAPTASAFTYTVGTAITNINLSASGGGTPYTYAISAGALPAGVNLASGVISGVPTTTGNGTFTVRATDDSNCTGIQVYTFTVNPVGTPVPPNPTTSIDNSLNNIVKISPNPSKGDFNIDLGKLNTGKSSVRVYDLQGKSVYSSEMNTNTGVISLDKIATGMYLLEITTAKGIITKRIIRTN